MAVSYNKLWKLLIDKKMSKADLRRAADLAPNTMTKLRRDEPVAMIVLEKICGTYLALEGLDPRVEILWDEISLQDITEQARAELYRAQAENLKKP